MLLNMITTTSVVALLLYFADVFFCIKAIKQKDSDAYKVTKPLLMPLLLFVFAAFLPGDLRLQSRNLLVATALVFHTLGDILLLFPKGKTKIFFFCGMLSFFAGHFFYMGSFLLASPNTSKAFAIGALAIVFVFEYFFYRQLVLDARRYAPLFLPYTFGLAVLGIVVVAKMGASSIWWAYLISLLGVVLFAFSDYCIARREMRMPIAGQMVVMPTYIAGQSLIILGTLLSQF